MHVIKEQVGRLQIDCIRGSNLEPFCWESNSLATSLSCPQDLNAAFKKYLQISMNAKVWTFSDVVNIPLEVIKQERHGVQVGLGKLMDQLLHSLHLLPQILGFCTHEEQVHA